MRKKYMYRYVSRAAPARLKSKAFGAFHQTLLAYANTDALNKEGSVKVSSFL